MNCNVNDLTFCFCTICCSHELSWGYFVHACHGFFSFDIFDFRMYCMLFLWIYYFHFLTLFSMLVFMVFKQLSICWQSLAKRTKLRFALLRSTLAAIRGLRRKRSDVHLQDFTDNDLSLIPRPTVIQSWTTVSMTWHLLHLWNK